MNKEITRLRTIRDFIRWGSSKFNAAGLFFGHGTDNALDEAAALVLHALNLQPDLPSSYLDTRVTANEIAAILELLQRRIDERIPAAYLMRKAWFAGLEFYVDQRVLVPRSPLAELIDNDLQPWLDPAQLMRVLDLGTGSGCIGISIAMHFPKVMVDLTDIDTAALAVASINVANFGLEDRVRVHQADVFEGLTGERYDLIITNPPYVATTELLALPDEYRLEPTLGLAGGTDGLEVVHRIMQDAAQHLTPHGVLIMEVGNSAEALEHAYPQVQFLWLSFERGGDGVCLLTAEQMRQMA